MRLRYIVQAVLLLSVWGVMLLPGGGEWYARHIYPAVSGGLSFFSSFFPFSVGDVFIYGSISGLLLYALVAVVRRRGVRRMLWREVVYLVWVYIWFYLAWGLNYSRADFYERSGVERSRYNEADFRKFIEAYADSLNRNYCPMETQPAEAVVADEIKAAYRELAPRYGLVAPRGYLRPKEMLFSGLMSAVGVSGYVGPFFIEYHLNRDLLPVEYPSTYAHELAHVLGIANEAEANYYSYRTCTRSARQEIRFSGYFALLPHVLSNARRALPKEDYQAWVGKLRPEVVELYREEAAHWQARYNPAIGELQNRIYTMYLKGNRISSGMANYSEVIALIMAEYSSGEGN